MDGGARSGGGPDDRFFRAVVERSTDATLVIDAALRVRYASPAALALVGEQGPLGPETDALAYVHPDDVPVLVALAGDQMGGAGYVLPMRFRLVRSDGDIRTVEAVSFDMSDDPDVGGLVVQMRDVTLAGEITPAEYRRERRFQRMLEQVSDGVALLDAEGRIITTSGVGRELLGGPGERIVGSELLARCRPIDRDHLVARSHDLLAGGAARVVEDVTWLDGDGSWHVLEVRGFNCLEDPVIGAIVLIARDVTAERAAEEVTAEAHRRAVRSLDQRREFIAAVSHELRTPIHGILGVAELLAQSTRTSDPSQLAGLISRSAEALLAMVDDLLDLSRLEVGRLDLVPGPVDVAALVEEVCALFRPESEAAGVEMEVSAGVGVPGTIVADGLRLRQVLSNLVSNAVKFTPAGRIEVTVDRTDDGAGVQVAVTDTGSGIPADEIDDLFTPFARGHGAVTSRAPGSGLGLAISRRIVEAMGGEIGVSSAVGKGSTFWVRLPVAGAGQVRLPDGPSASSPGAAPTDGAPGDGAPAPLVLVVEDDPTSQVLVEHQLARLGYRCQVVATGEAIVDAWRDARPAIVLVDDRLPGIDGREAARMLRAAELAEGGRARVPVVAVTATPMAGDAAFADAGIDEVLAKPVRLEALAELLDRHVPVPSVDVPVLPR